MLISTLNCASSVVKSLSAIASSTVGVEQRRVARLVGQVELDLEPHRAPLGVEARLREHAREHVEARAHLLAVALPVLAAEDRGGDVLAHVERNVPGLARVRPSFGELPRRGEARSSSSGSASIAIRSWVSVSRSRSVTVSVLERLVVDGDAVGRADLVLAAVALADRAALVVLALEARRACSVAWISRATLGVAVLAQQRQHRDLHRRERGVELEHRARARRRCRPRRRRRTGTRARSGPTPAAGSITCGT